MKKIRVIPEYGLSPFWDCDNARYISPNDLKISDELKMAVSNWTARYDSTLDMSDPASSGFKTDEEEEDFKKEGERILQCLKNELGNEYVFD